MLGEEAVIGWLEAKAGDRVVLVGVVARADNQQIGPKCFEGWNNLFAKEGVTRATIRALPDLAATISISYHLLRKAYGLVLTTPP